jgi:hypothetical protein
MNESLFSVHNELPADSTDDSYFELNPAIVSSDGGRKYALSAVCVGPPLDSGEAPLSLEVRCDGDGAVIDAVHQQSEATSADVCLTVALFSVSEAFLELLASAQDVRVEFGPPAARLCRALDARSRSNLLQFLELVTARAELEGAPAGAAA